MSFPINVANVIYQGAEVRFVQQFDHLYLRAQYGLNVAYPYNLPATVANPTSGGNLVGNAQFLNIPQQVGSLGLDWVNQAWHGALDATFRGNNNELNRPAFAVFNAGIGKRVSQGLDLSLAFTNLTNEASGRFTLPGQGVPYRGVVGLGPDNQPLLGNLPTDRLSIEPFGVRFIVTLRK
jgi:outer membrane receptor protein involved in Fe transport